jgi:hypothetical protein
LDSGLLIDSHRQQWILLTNNDQQDMPNAFDFHYAPFGQKQGLMSYAFLCDGIFCFFYNNYDVVACFFSMKFKGRRTFV